MKLNTKSLKELTAIYNDKSGKSVKMLKCSKQQAIEKIMALKVEVKPEKKSKKEKVVSKRSILVKLIKSGINELGELFEMASEIKATITEKDCKWTLKFYERALNI